MLTRMSSSQLDLNDRAIAISRILDQEHHQERADATRDDIPGSNRETGYWPIDPPSRSSAKSRSSGEDFPAIRSPISCAAIKLNVMPLPP